ncbi:uncharacterized protein LOC128203318 [Mya arenaria]|uniref:uncharacterized protein LOC128203318 n=1 Tax=Mya arenaria TaxID=6604 RepID=UPI0022E1A7B3|nr:uncharacterized protein LOC128203318 [Mya arenaria]
MISWTSLILLLSFPAHVLSNSSVFPSGDRFTVVNVEDLEDARLYQDVKRTGSLLIDTEDTPSTLDKSLAQNVPVSDFRSPAFRYVRAHPKFLSCLEKVIMALKHQQILVRIVKGFSPSVEVDGSEADMYHMSGCAADLQITGSAGTNIDIAVTVFKVCPVVVERAFRDVGVILKDDVVHVQMTGPGSSGHKLVVEGQTTIANPDQWVKDRINEGLDPSGDADCSRFDELTTGGHHPAGMSRDRATGTVDFPVTRDSVEFARLVQYQGSNIEFENSEVSATWCGQPGSACPSTCAHALLGNDLESRCADRVMSPRLLAVLNKLQLKVRRALQDKLLVFEAWDEQYEGHLEGDTPEDSLHREGRAARLGLTSGTEAKLAQLSRLAACAGADFVEHMETYVYVAVRRQLVGGSRVLFPHMELLEVEPPAALQPLYSLSAAYTESDKRKYPLFDSSGRLEATLSTNFTIGQWVSRDYSYFRLDPRLLECYNDVVYQENKLNKPRDTWTQLEVVRGFMTNKENRNKFDVINDKRFNTHNLGVAMQIKYRNPQAGQTPYKLFLTAIDKCSPRFSQSGMAMGVGLYADSIYVSVRKSLHVMQETEEHLPESVTMNDVTERYNLAKGGKIVDPTDVESACLLQTAPQPQSYHFRHTHSEVVQRARRRREAGEESACVPTRYTSFCSTTASHRAAVVADITAQLDRKHFPGPSRTDIMAALEGCFGDCGTCMEGEIFESKKEHCNNFLHWVDWELLNDRPDVSNFFLRSNRAATKHACDHGADCVENSPLFSLVAPSVEKIYRPDPTRSVENELYSATNNPLPVFRLLEDMYAIQASGVVNFWVKDDREMTALKRPLEVVMLYNRNVTLVRVYVERYSVARGAVQTFVETSARTWATTGCPAVTRETIAQYEILEIPPEKRKRAAEPDSVRYQIRDYHGNVEARWADRHIML